MTFLEALAGGAPVVAIDSAAARELAGPALTVGGRDADALAHAILAALGAPDRLARRAAARDAVRPFDVAVRAAALAEVYDRAIGARPDARPVLRRLRPAA